MNAIKQFCAGICTKFCRDTRGNTMFAYAVMICLVCGGAYMLAGYQGTGGGWEPPQLISMPNWSPM